MDKNILKPFDKPIYITSPTIPDWEDFEDQYKEIKHSGKVTNFGEKHNLLEKHLRKYLGVKNLLLFNNGTTALMSAIKALNLEGEIITTPYTFAATINSILWNNLTPVFCDIDDNYNIDTSKIEELITDKTCAILAVHTFGIPCDYNTIKKYADRYKLSVIYDCAHSFGVKVDGKSIGTLGDISMFSFHATKIFNTLEGGCLCCKDSYLAEKINKYRNFGLDNNNIVCPGINGKLNEFQAAIGLLNLPHVEKEINLRKHLAEIYCKELSDVKGLEINKIPKNISYNYQYFIINLFETGLRDYLHDKLKDYNIFTKKYMYPCATEYKYIKTTQFTPKANIAAKSTLALPIYGKMSNYDTKKICTIIKHIIEFYYNNRF